MDVNELERRIERLESKLENIDTTFNVFRDVLIKIQNENVQLRRNRDFLLEKHKDLLKKSVNKEKLSQEIRQKLVEPVRSELQEDIQLIKKLTTAKEGIDENSNSSSHLDELFALVMNNDKISLKNAAKYFNVHELQVQDWAQALEDHGLIDIVKNGQEIELRKSSYE